MKNTVLKYYIVAFYLCSTFVMFADPGSNTGDGGLEGETGDNTPTTPINGYVLVLAMVGLIYAFHKFRAYQNQKMNS